MEKEKYIKIASLAEQAECFEKMAKAMREHISEKGEMTALARNLFSVAFKNVVGAKRTSWRIMSSFESCEEGDELKLQLIRKFKKKIEDEIVHDSMEVIKMIDSLVEEEKSSEKSFVNFEAIVFYLKMKGDYNRYVAEVTEDMVRSEAMAEAEKAYSDATSAAQTHLSSSHPVKLGLALNQSVFYCEIVNDLKTACKIVKTTLESAHAELLETDDDSAKDSRLIMQLLRDNLTLWTSEEPLNDDDPLQ